MTNKNMINKLHLQEILKCDLCNQSYDSEIHIPMVVKCGHTFCKNCLQQKRNNEKDSLNCPIDNINDVLNFDTSIRNIKIEDILIKILNCETNQKVYTKPDIKKKSKEETTKKISHTKYKSYIEFGKNLESNLKQFSTDDVQLNTSLANETIEPIQMNDDKSTVNNSFLTELHEFFEIKKNYKNKEGNNNPNLIKSINIHFNNLKAKKLNEHNMLKNNNNSLNPNKDKTSALEKEKIEINKNTNYVKDKNKSISRNSVQLKINNTNMLYNYSSNLLGMLSPLNFKNNKITKKCKKENVFIHGTSNEIKTPIKKTYQYSTYSNVKKSFSNYRVDKNSKVYLSPFENNKIIYNKKTNINKKFSSDKVYLNLKEVCKTHNFMNNQKNDNSYGSHSQNKMINSYNVTANNSREKNYNKNMFNGNINQKFKTIFVVSRNSPSSLIKRYKTTSTNENNFPIKIDYSSKSYREHQININNNVNNINKSLNTNGTIRYSTNTMKNNKIICQKKNSQERNYKTATINVNCKKKTKEINENNNFIEKIKFKLISDFQSIIKNEKYINNKTKYEKLFDNIINNNNKNSYLSKLILENILKLTNNINSIKVTFINNSLNLFIGIYDNENNFPIKGILLQENGDKYEGEFKNSKKDGKGKITYENGWIYEGNFANDKQNGFGKMTQSDNEKYEGEWKDGKMNGEGTRIHNNGDKYIGNYINNIRNGFGKYYFSNGDYYEGNWEDGKESGNGVFYYHNGEKYEGEFKNNLICGKGSFYKKNGDIYVGEFVDGLINGKGTITKENGDKFYGNFIKGEKNGYGKLVDKSGKIIRMGYWKKDD